MMNKITTVIIDDLDSARNLLNKLLCNYDEVNVVAETDNAKSGFELIKKFQPELVFLDIKMEDDNSGIQLAEKIQNLLLKPPLIVFITAYTDHNIGDIINVKPLCFLNKPISSEEVLDIITTVKAELDNRINFKQNALERMKIAVGRDYHYINPASDILYIEAYNDSTEIYLEDGRVLKTRIRLWNYEESLAPINICQTHKGFIINLSKIDAVIALENSDAHRAILKNCERKIPVSRRFYKKIIQKLDLLQ